MVMPGWVSPSCGPMTWTMPWLGEPMPWSGMPNSAQFVSSWRDLGGGHLVEDRQVARRRRDRVVGRRDGLARMAHAEAARAQTGEGLRAGDLVDEVQVDREDRRGAGVLGDDVVVPDLGDDGAGLGHGAWLAAIGSNWGGERTRAFRFDRSGGDALAERVVRALEQLGLDRLGGGGPAEEVALAELAAEAPQHAELLVGLDAFGDHRQPE